MDIQLIVKGVLSRSAEMLMDGLTRQRLGWMGSTVGVDARQRCMQRAACTHAHHACKTVIQKSFAVTWRQEVRISFFEVCPADVKSSRA